MDHPNENRKISLLAVSILSAAFVLFASSQLNTYVSEISFLVPIYVLSAGICAVSTVCMGISNIINKRRNKGRWGCVIISVISFAMILRSLWFDIHFHRHVLKEPFVTLFGLLLCFTAFFMFYPILWKESECSKAQTNEKTEDNKNENRI